jgi:hypothetical protein
VIQGLTFAMEKDKRKNERNFSGDRKLNPEPKKG